MSGFRCRHGWHSWRFCAISDPLYLTGYGAPVLRDLDEQCRRCGLRQRRVISRLPRRVKT